MSAPDRGFRVMSLFDEEAVPIDNGLLGWVPVRRRLGIAAFGTNGYRAARAGDPVVEEHVESPGQQELYLVVRGRAEFTLDGEVAQAPSGTLLFVPDPATMRSAVALEDDTVVLAVGGWPDRAYHDLPWEPIYLAREAISRGDWAAAAQTLEREAGDHRDTAIIRFRLAWCHARAGDADAALTELRGAVSVNPDMLQRALDDEYLVQLRELPGWPAEPGQPAG